MDRNFISWLSLLFAPSYANKVAQRVQYLFEIEFLKPNKTINTMTFKRLANMNNDLRMLMKKESATEMDLGSRFASIKAYSMYQTLVALQLYCEFHGVHRISSDMIKQLSLRVRNQDESYAMNMLLHPMHTVHHFNIIVRALRILQEYIDDCMHHSFLFQYTAGMSTHWEKTKMACMVFLELCIRFFCHPMPTSAVSNLRYYPKTDRVSRDYPYIYYHDNGQMFMCIPIKNTTGKDTRMQNIELPGTISLYLHFYLTRCRNKSSTLEKEDLLFMKPSSSVNASIKWETIVPSVRRVLGEMGVDESTLRELGLMPPGSRYEYASKLLFAVTKTYLHGKDILDVDALSKYMYVADIGLAVSQSSKYYFSMDHIRVLRSALTRFGYSIPTCGYTLLYIHRMRSSIRNILVDEIMQFVKYRKK